MQIYILGKNSDDKGHQLEVLTYTILKVLHCRNIVKNEIGSGGHEIDIRAEYTVPSLSGNQNKPLICECKAYQSTVGMTDWLKFLGKIFLEKLKGDIDGYFIALSGVNGNVIGNYRDLQSKTNNIHLITGEDLAEILTEIFNLSSYNIIQRNILKYTQRQLIEINLYYYNLHVYYVIGLSENEFALFTNTGDIIGKSKAEEINKLILENTKYQSFIDLEDENNALARFSTIKKFVASLIFLQTNELTIEVIHKSMGQYSNQIPDIKTNEVQKALDTLVAESILFQGDNISNYGINFILNDSGIGDVVKFYKYLTNYILPLFVLGSEVYIKYINEELLSEICRIQGGIIIPNDKREECLKILKWSPSALSWSLEPIPMLINHRSGGKTLNQEMDTEDTAFFLQGLINNLSEDFRNKSLNEYFYKTCGLVELENNFSIRLKSKTKTELEMKYKERIGLAQLTEEYGNKIIHIRIFDKQPEPWEGNRAKQ